MEIFVIYLRMVTNMKNIGERSIDMQFISEILEYVARGFYSVYDFKDGFWVLLIKAILG